MLPTVILLISSACTFKTVVKNINNKNIIFFSVISNVSADEIKRITIGNKDAKITIIAFESLTCSHCANFHKDVFPQLKEEFLDKGIAKIEFRHFPLDIVAFNASKVSQCRNDGNSDILESLYNNQQKWVKGNSIEEANKNLQKFLKNEEFKIDLKYFFSNFEFFEHPKIEKIKFFSLQYF